jgi:hypothetical protein
MASIYRPRGLVQAMQDRLEEYAEMRARRLEPSLGRMRSPMYLPTAAREDIARKLGVCIRTTARYDAKLKEAS